MSYSYRRDRRKPLTLPMATVSLNPFNVLNESGEAERSAAAVSANPAIYQRKETYRRDADEEWGLIFFPTLFLQDIMNSEKSYDSLPNFTAADCEFPAPPPPPHTHTHFLCLFIRLALEFLLYYFLSASNVYRAFIPFTAACISLKIEIDSGTQAPQKTSR